MPRSFRIVFGVVVLAMAFAACGGDDVTPPADSGLDARADAADTGVDANRIDAGACPDVDRDGVGAAPCGDDCDDADPTRYPGATEYCDYEGHDEDCNPTTYGTKDDDADGVSDSRCCNGTACALDCDDTRGGTRMGVPEVCNRRDDDCNALTDDDGVQVPGFSDLDRDLYGDATAPVMACAGSGLSTNSTDCDDSVTTGSRASPAFEEITGDGIDNDCNGMTDEAGGGVMVWYLDADGDGFGTTADMRTSSANQVGYALTAGDCDDTSSARSPAAPELCNGVDDNCNGLLDYELGVNNWEDDDMDGFVDVGCGAAGSDCDDGARGTHPGAAEVCDGRDNDCDTMRDESCSEPGDGGVPVDMGPSDLGRSDLGPADMGPPDMGAPDAGPPLASYFKASNTGFGDTFGWSLSLSADGSRSAVGARCERSNATGIDGDQLNNTAPCAGAVYVFARAGTVWSQEAYIKASNTDTSDEFGISVSMSADGSRLAVGADFEGSSAVGIGGNQALNDAFEAGAVYVFSRVGSTWAQEAYIKASNTGASDHFGGNVSISADGARLAVGARGERSNATGIGGDATNNSFVNAGAAYVFSRTGTTWAQDAYIKASSTGDRDEFGYAVSLSGDGTRLAVGAWNEDSLTGVEGDNTGLNVGAVYAFVRSGATWSQEAYLKAAVRDSIDNFGQSVSLSFDGSRLAVGAPRESSSATGVGGDANDDTVPNSGAAYIFSRTVSSWTQDAYIKASNTGNLDTFGTSISLSADGLSLVVGAPLEDSPARNVGGDQTMDSALGAGAAYRFSFGTVWTQTAYVKAFNTEGGERFGKAVSLSSDGAVLGVAADLENSNATGIGGDQYGIPGLMDSGAVYLY